jgi:hypothetical protein
MDIRANQPWHIIYKDENGMLQRTRDFSSREGVLAKAHYLSRTCEIIQILDAGGASIEVSEIADWRKRNLDIWVLA